MLRRLFTLLVVLPFALWIGLSVPAPAAAQSWERRIAAARAEAAEIEAYAEGFGFDYNNAMGRMARWSDSDAIQCTVLAEMVGLAQTIAQIEFFLTIRRPKSPFPPRVSFSEVEQADQLLTYAWALNSWARYAEQFQALSADQRAEQWELSCNGKHGIPLGTVPPNWNKTASFRMERTTLRVLGDIEPGFFEAFKRVLEENEVTSVALGSRGGSVEDAMKAGGLIRQLGLKTWLDGDCESACPLIYFGGVEPRVMFGFPIYRLGFHQVSAGKNPIPLDSPIYETIGAYVAAMGVDADFVLSAMKSTPPDQLYFPDWGIYCDVNFADGVFESCNWPYNGLPSDIGRFDFE
jgi:hypothetical protein